MSSLAIKEYREVDFYGDQILGVKVEENGQETVYVPVKRLCENLGLARYPQQEKIQQERVLSEGSIKIMLPIIGKDGVTQTQEMFCLRYDLIPMWLITIKENKVKPELREKLYLYKKEAARVLAEVFLGKGYAFHSNPQAVDTEKLRREIIELEIKRDSIRSDALKTRVIYKFVDKWFERLPDSERSALIMIMAGKDVAVERTFTVTEAAKLFAKEFGYDFSPIILGKLITQAGIRPEGEEKENKYCLISITKARGSNRTVNITKIKPESINYLREYIRENFFSNQPVKVG